MIPKLYHGERRTFLSVSYEGVRDRTSRSFLDTVPTDPERSGDFSKVVDQAGESLPIFDPATTRPNVNFDPSQPVATGNLQYFRDPFPGNRIAPARLNGASQALLSYYPSPNAAVGPFDRNNYFLLTPATNNADGLIAKIDHSIRQRHRLSAEMAFSNGLEQPALRLPSAANPGAPVSEFRSRRGAIEHVFTKSPRTLINYRFNAETQITSSGGESGADYAGEIGLRGSSSGTFPAFSFYPYIPMGRYAPRSRSARTLYTWEGAYSLRLEKHSLRFRLRHRREQVNVLASRFPAGSFRFGEGLTSLPGIINTGHAFASFLLGLPEFAEKTVVLSPSYFRRYSFLASMNEQYEARRGLNLSLGLNLVHNSPRFEKYNRQSTVDLRAINPANGRPGALVVAGQNGQGRAFQPQFVKLEPSVGIAWNPRGDPKLVLRGSFRRDYQVAYIQSNQWATQAFNDYSSYTSPNVQLEPALLLSEGLPPLSRPLPDVRPEAVNDTTADLVDSSDRQPTTQAASFEVQRQLPASAILTAGFNYQGGKNMLVSNNAAGPDALPLSALVYRDELYNEDFYRSLSPYPQYKGFDAGNAYPVGRFQRREGFISVEKRATAGLSLSVGYQISRQWDDYSGWYPRQDYYNRRNEWSLSAYNRPRQLSLSYIYELPFGAGKPLVSASGWRRRLAEGWAVSGSTSFLSGTPILLRPLFNNTGGVAPGLRVNAVPGVNPRVADPGPALWFNPAAFDQPPDFTIGNGPRTHPALRNPSFQNHDLSLTKRISLTPEKALEFSAVALNFLNHANWEDPDPVIGPASAPNVNAGRIIGSRGGRVMQLGLRISF